MTNGDSLDLPLTSEVKLVVFNATIQWFCLNLYVHAKYQVLIFYGRCSSINQILGPHLIIFNDS